MHWLFIVASKYAIIVSKSFPRKSGAALLAKVSSSVCKSAVPAVRYTNLWQNKRRNCAMSGSVFSAYVKAFTMVRRLSKV
jgi:hypothetical protein